MTGCAIPENFGGVGGLRGKQGGDRGGKWEGAEDGFRFHCAAANSNYRPPVNEHLHNPEQPCRNLGTVTSERQFSERSGSSSHSPSKAGAMKTGTRLWRWIHSMRKTPSLFGPDQPDRHRFPETKLRTLGLQIAAISEGLGTPYPPDLIDASVASKAPPAKIL